MTKLFHARPSGRSTEIQSMLSRKAVDRSNQDYNFLRGSFSSRDNVRASTQFRRETVPAF